MQGLLSRLSFALIAISFALNSDGSLSANPFNEDRSPIIARYEFDNPDFEDYADAVLDLLNLFRLIGREVGSNYSPENLDLVFVSAYGAVSEEGFSEEVNGILGDEISERLSEIDILNDRCVSHKFELEGDVTVVAVQNSASMPLDFVCFNLSLAHFFGLDLEAFADLSDIEGLQLLLEQSRR